MVNLFVFSKKKKYPEKYICLETGHYYAMLAEDR
jgi:hypothetical protein